MYRILLIFSFFVLSKAAFDQNGITMLSNACNATEDDTKVVRKYLVPSTPTGKCLMLCYSKLLDMLTPDGVYDQTKSLTSLRTYWKEIPDTTLVEVNNFCYNQAITTNSKAEPCEYGYLLMKCINSQFLEKHLLSSA